MSKKIDAEQLIQEEVLAKLKELPSRKQKHPKPTAFFEKPTFSLLLFILFLFVLGGILFYYYYNNDNTLKGNENKQNNSPVQQLPMDKDEPSQQNQVEADKQDNLPVVIISDPIVDSTNPNANGELENGRNEADYTDVQYEVVAGDTLYNIARRYYVAADADTIKKIMDANKLADTTIRIGMKLVLPSPPKKP